MIIIIIFSSPGRVQPHMGEDKTHCVVRMSQSKLTHENEDWCNIYKCASKNLDAGVITSDAKPSRRP